VKDGLLFGQLLSPLFLLWGTFLWLWLLFELIQFTHGLTFLVPFELLLDLRIRLVYVLGEYLWLVHLLINELLGILTGELVLRDVRELLVHNGGLLALRIEDRGALRDLPEAAHYGGMNQTDWFVYVGVVNARDQGRLCFLDQVLLNRPDALHVLDVLVELGVDGHVLGPHCEPLLVLVLIRDANDEGDTRGVLLHHV
jgi:hypothetical protein